MLYILYQDENGRNLFDTAAEPYRPGFDAEWRQANPTKTLVSVHDAENDLTAIEQHRRINFNVNCGAYGFRPADYLSLVRLENNRVGQLVGFNPKNRKYPCLIQPLRNGEKRIKATVDYVRRMACDAC